MQWFVELDSAKKNTKYQRWLNLKLKGYKYKWLQMRKTENKLEGATAIWRVR